MLGRGRGPATRLVLELADLLDRVGVRPIVVAHPAGALFAHAPQLDRGVVGLESTGGLAPLDARRLARIVRRERALLVHAVGTRAIELAALATRLSGLPLVATADLPDRLPRGGYGRWAHRRAAAVLAADPPHRAALIAQLRVPAPRVGVLPWPLGLAPPASDAASTATPGAAERVLALYRAVLGTPSLAASASAPSSSNGAPGASSAATTRIALVGQ
jgi:hypothetical protein